MNELRQDGETETSERPRAVIYCRLASVKQTEASGALQSQEEHCQAFADRRGYDVIKVVTDAGASGANVERRGIKELLDVLKQEENAGQCVVVVEAPERLARNQRVFVELHDAISSTGAALDYPGREPAPAAADLLVERVHAFRSAMSGRRSVRRRPS